MDSAIVRGPLVAASASERCAAGGSAGVWGRPRPHKISREAVNRGLSITGRGARCAGGSLKEVIFLQEKQLQGVFKITGLTCDDVHIAATRHA